MIRILTYLFLLAACPSIAQNVIKKSDGTVIPVTEAINIDHAKKQVSFGKSAIKFTEIDSISFNGKVFKTFKIGKKTRGYYLIAESDGMFLAAISRKKTSSVGGFNVPYTLHEIAFISAGKIIDEISFTENNDRKNIKKRQQAREMILDKFSGCVPLLERLAFFAGNETNLREADVVGILVPAVYVRCQ